MDFHLTAIGLFVGFMVGLTGVGGAAILTPLLILLGISPTIAVGTDLAYNSITKIFGTFQHWRQRTVNVKVVRLFAIGSVPSAIIAVLTSQWIRHLYGSSDFLIKKVLGFALILIPVCMIVKAIHSRRSGKPSDPSEKPFAEKRGLPIAIGAILGFIVGLTSIGSGSLFALALMYLFPMSGKEIVGTDIAHALLLVTAAGLAHASFGNVDYSLMVQLLSGSIPGVFLGSILSTKVPTFLLRWCITLLILISGIKLL